jgi:hypothetical protein
MQGLILRIERLESSNLALRAMVGELTHGVAKIEEENLSLKKKLNDNKKQYAPPHHPPGDTLHKEIIDLKNKQEEIKSQQAAFKQETHINSWAQVVRGRDKVPPPPPPPLAAIKEVVQAKTIEERTKRAQELNLKVRGLPLPIPSSNTMVIETSFLNDNIGIQNVTLDRAWMGSNSTLFLRFRSAVDRLQTLGAKRVVFSS